MAAFFGDVDVAVLVDAEQIGNEFGGHAAEHCAVARPHDVNLLLRNEERARAQDGFELARLVSLHAAREPVSPARLSELALTAKRSPASLLTMTASSIAIQADATGNRPGSLDHRVLSGGAVEREQAEAAPVARHDHDLAIGHERGSLRRGTFRQLANPTRSAGIGIEVVKAHRSASTPVGLPGGGEERLVIEPYVTREAQPIASAPDDVARPEVDGRQGRVPRGHDEKFAGAAEAKNTAPVGRVAPAHLPGAEVDGGETALAVADHEHARQAG